MLEKCYAKIVQFNSKAKRWNKPVLQFKIKKLRYITQLVYTNHNT